MIIKSTAEEEAMKRLRAYLGASGLLFPVTANQLAAFKNYVTHEMEEKDTYPDLNDILNSDYRKPKPEHVIRIKTADEARNVVRYAARNGSELTEEVLRIMRADREKK